MCARIQHSSAAVRRATTRAAGASADLICDRHGVVEQKVVVPQAKEWLRAAGASKLASGLGKLTSARNSCCRPDVALLGDLGGHAAAQAKISVRAAQQDGGKGTAASVKPEGQGIPIDTGIDFYGNAKAKIQGMASAVVSEAKSELLAMANDMVYQVRAEFRDAGQDATDTARARMLDDHAHTIYAATATTLEVACGVAATIQEMSSGTIDNAMAKSQEAGLAQEAIPNFWQWQCHAFRLQWLNRPALG